MIIKIKKRDLVIAGFILIFLVPVIYAEVGVKKAGFGVELWIGNFAPLMVFDPGTSSSLARDPLAGQSVLVWFVFNVTDDNGADDIKEDLTRFNLTLGTPGFAQWRFNETCTNVSKSIDDRMVIFNCSVRMRYFDNASSNWVLNATAFDVSLAQAINDTRTFQYNELSGMSIPRAWMNFSSPTIGANNYPTGGINITLNNTGNDDFEQINITAADLIGTVSGVFGIGNFTANYSNANDGGFALNGTGQTFLMQDGTYLLLSHGHTSASTDYNDDVISAKGNQSLYFWVNVPSTGLTAQKYNNTWNITVIDLTP